MASKVLISLPTTTSFQSPSQIGCDRNDYIPARMTNNEYNIRKSTTSSKDPLLRIDELEKNIKFLKDEQKRMLCSLHKEIASLQSKNRDLLYQLIFKSDCDLEYQNAINDTDVKYILMNNIKHKQTQQNDSVKDTNGSIEESYEMKYTIDQQQREIEYLKGQLELVAVRNKNQNHESRQVDGYIRELEDKNKDQEKLVRLLRKENKDQKAELENLRKTLNNSIRINHNPQNIQIAHHIPQQTPLFPPVGAPPSTYWCQNRPIPIDYQLQRTSVSANGNDRASVSIPGVSYTLPSVCNYRQVAVTAPPPRFYSNASYFYSVAQRPMLRSKSYSSENGIRSPNRNLPNGSKV
ncbi:uncharacterized protein LOC135850131 [Planococcus citri]|uniref:uncharacterized protein LOC135850131 n=1 Tax=Planococcus citri TaxID=170843 RepID=UPI0031FA3681